MHTDPTRRAATGHTGTTPRATRRHTRSRRTAILTIIALVLVAVPAFAGVPANEPSGCNTVATGGWYRSCWVSNNGADPDRISDFSTAIQTVLAHNYEWNDNPGSIDGYFGNNTYAATRRFQANHGLQADGIVGNQTWNRLQGDLVFNYGTSYHYYHVENYSPIRFRQNAATAVWDVLRKRNGRWRWVRVDRWRS